MTEAKRVFPVITVHFLLGLILCLVYSFTRQLDVDLIAPFVTGYRIRSGILLFVQYMPALQISGLLVGYALAFGKKTGGQVDRWSKELFSHLRGAFLLCLFCVSLYVVLSEGLSPFFAARQMEVSERTDDYHDYMTVAAESLKAGSLVEAEIQVNGALQIWKASKDADFLLGKIQYEAAVTGVKETGKRENNTAADSVAIARTSGGITVLEALDKAYESEKILDFYNMHYYAVLASRLAGDLDPNKAVALEVAARAWNRMTTGTDLARAEDDARLYGTKQDGYDAIQRLDYLKAYYIFLELQEKETASGDGKIDPDVARFLEVSRKGVLDSFFFIDETLNMRLFESARNVFFVIRHPGGSSDSVLIQGVTYTRSAGKDMAYLRGLEIARFDADNALLYQISVPYAKLFPFAGNRGKAMPQLFLRAVSRSDPSLDIVPTVISGSVPEQEKNMMVLDMPYADFSLLVSANRGAGTLPLFDLFRFIEKAEVYGFSRGLYLAELIARLSDPFLMLILSIYALALGWKYSLAKNAFFKAWWILAVPLFPVLSLFAIGTVRYLSRLCIAVFIELVPQNPVLLTLLFLSFSFAAVSVYFFSQRSGTA